MKTGWNFSRRQRNGLLVLVVIILTIIGFRYGSRLGKQKDQITAPPPLAVVPDSSYIKKRKQYKQKGQRPTFSHKKKTRPEAGTININLAQAADLERLPGIGPVFSKRIVKYRDAIGGFDSVAQLKQVYGLPPETYDDLAALFFITKKQVTDAKKRVDTFPIKKFDPRPSASYMITDLNSADSVALDALPGIGPTLSRRIIKFRNRIGYFASADMLTLVYGLSEENYNKALPWLSISPTEARPLSLRTAEWKDLKNLSFLSKKSINAILTQKRNMIPFISWDEVAKLPEMDSTKTRWLKGYATLK
ncbi:MAG: ComEA family DNA-binding protein [Bacteroidia bacterium]